LEFAIARQFKSPSFAPDPAVADLWEPINLELSNVLGRTPEVFALTSYDALWMMVLSYLLADDPQDHVQFQSSFEELTEYYNGITGRTTLDENGDRKFASFNFWGVRKTGNSYDWQILGYYRNVDDQLFIF
jgi:ABC-type branched-subunit amino acid transport system substrate-binding protein